MSYYWFNKQEILQKAKEKYSQEKAAEYYAQNKEVIKEKSRVHYKNWSQEKALNFNNIRVNKKEFHKSKEPIDLMSVNVDQIVVSNKFKHNNKAFKYLIGYQEGGIVKPLCILLPQMSGYIKYFENGGKTCLF